MCPIVKMTSFNIFIMSTAPKLTYAKIGNKSKNRIEASSSQLTRRDQQKSEDLFSQMNQDNLNYIQKELKLKKHRSNHDKTKNQQSDVKGMEVVQDNTRIEKLSSKYNDVSQKEQCLEESERNREEQLTYNEIQQNNRNQQSNKNMDKRLTISHNAYQKDQSDNYQEQAHMYQSVPYAQPKIKPSSIEGYLCSNRSININKNIEQGAKFIDFLQQYISDLHFSQQLPNKIHQQSLIDKKVKKISINTAKNMENSNNRNQSAEIDSKTKKDLRKLQKLKRNSDTFGQPNSKYTINSSVSNEYLSNSQLQLQLKQQRLNCLTLAREIQKLRSSLKLKQQIIQKLELNNELLYEKIIHLRTNQQIIKNKYCQHSHKHYPSQRSTRRRNDENLLNQSEDRYFKTQNRLINEIKGRQIDDRLKYEELIQEKQPLFQQFAPSTNKSPYSKKTSRKNLESAEKLSNQYSLFLANIEKDRFNFRKQKII